MATPERGPEARARHFPKVTPSKRVMLGGRVPLTHGQEVTEAGKVVLHLRHLWRYWQLVRHPQPYMPIKSKHRSMFATPVGLGFRFTGTYQTLWKFVARQVGNSSKGVLGGPGLGVCMSPTSPHAIIIEDCQKFVMPNRMVVISI
jgi:hypothetical protein